MTIIICFVQFMVGRVSAWLFIFLPLLVTVVSLPYFFEKEERGLIGLNLEARPRLAGLGTRSTEYFWYLEVLLPPCTYLDLDHHHKYITTLPTISPCTSHHH